MQKKKKQIYLGALSMLLLMKATPAKAFSFDSEELKEKFNQGMSFFSDVDSAVNGFVDSVITYKHDTLKLVTAIPNENPDEKREYYFYNSKFPDIERNKYYDANGNEVSKKEEFTTQVTMKYYKDIVNDEFNFIEKTTINYATGEITSNTVTLSNEEQYLKEPDDSIEYGYFEDISAIVPESLIKEKYSAADVKRMSEVINDVTFAIAPENSLERTLK